MLNLCIRRVVIPLVGQLAVLALVHIRQRYVLTQPPEPKETQ